MNKKIKKIVLVILLILLILITILTIMYLIKIEKEKYVNNIQYDIKIDYISGGDNSSGWANENYFDLINIDDKKAYLISDFYIYGKSSILVKGHNYKIKKVELTDDDIQEVLTLYNQAEEYNKSSNTIEDQDSSGIRIDKFADIANDKIIIDYNGVKKYKYLDNIESYFNYKK